MKTSTVIGLALAAAGARAQSVNYTQAYNWKSVRTGASGGFVTGIVFHPKVSGVAYARTDIGGLYKLNSADDSWVALQDYVDDSNWNEHGVDALALDPKNPNIVYIAAGIYTNSWDPYNGKIMKSVDSGKTWIRAPLPFKFGGNMGGRQMGERLAVDPNNSNILYFGARSGNGLWKSTNAGVTWSKVTSYTAVGTHIIQPGDTGQNGDIIGLTFVTFDSTSGTSAGSSRIFVGTADATNTVYMSTNSGATWTAIPGQPTGFLSHAGRFSPTEKALYVSYVDNANTYGGGDGYVYKYYVETGVWKKILDDNGTGFGFGGLDLDAQKNGTVMVATYHQWWPDGNIYRSLDGGDTWTTIWDFDWSGVQPPVKRRYNNWDVSDAQWLPAVTGDKWTGWMMGQLAINPHDSNHFLYGTGATVFGSKQLLNWDSNTPFTLKSLSYGMEQTAVLGLISPPSGPPLISVVGDVGGWTHTNLDVAPTVNHNPFPGTHRSIDYAGSKSNYIIRTADEAGGLAVSTDSGATWHKHASSGTYGGGKAIVSANADFIVWNVGQEVFISLKEGAFSKITSLPSAYYVLAADRKHNGLFYAAEGNNFYVSTNAGTSFNKTATLGYVRLIAANPYRQGDVWVATDNGIWHSIDQGSTFAKVGPATEAWHVALGKGATANAYPAIFAAATIQGKKGGHFRSDDGGYTWTLISDAQNGFGTPGNDIYAADPRTYGRVYIGTNGRGIFYGSPKGASTIPVAADAYQQCGGSGYNGPTKCAHGWSCKVSNAYYSQCL